MLTVNHRPRPGLGSSTNIPANYGDHEAPGDNRFESEVIEQDLLITSTLNR